MRQGIKEKDIRDFEKFCEKLNIVMKRIRTYQPEACGYLNDDHMNLLSGSSHEGHGNSQRERSVACIWMPDFSGGGW